MTMITGDRTPGLLDRPAPDRLMALPVAAGAGPVMARRGEEDPRRSYEKHTRKMKNTIWATAAAPGN
jgi:hypothetical protein